MQNVKRAEEEAERTEKRMPRKKESQTEEKAEKEKNRKSETEKQLPDLFRDRFCDKNIDFFPSLVSLDVLYMELWVLTHVF